MSTQRLAIADLGRIFDGETISGLSEWQLLERYLELRDELAFEALVTRHGPMVLGVCRRALGASPDADDAFQATFLVLVRRARDLGPRDAIGPWLHGVARRVANRARNRAERRMRARPISDEVPIVARPETGPDPDLVEILDRELSRLPAKYRDPLVLCYLEGRTHEEAARDLGWPVGTVKGRLSRARELLRDRLTRRGFAPSSGAILAVSSPELRMILDRSLVEQTVGASVKLAAGHSVAQAVSQSIASLVEGVLTTMFLSKLKWAAAVVMASGLVFTSAAVLGRQPAAKNAGPDVQQNTGPGPVRNNGAVTKKMMGPQPGLPGSTPFAYQIVKTPVRVEPGQPTDERSLEILAKLEEPISMSFANETPLEDVLKYIKQATTTPTYTGIPIYVDPIGLQDAERSLNSTIQIDLEGVPLRRTLQLLLTQLGLAYYVEDGILVVTYEDLARKPLPPCMAKPAPILTMIEKAERGEMTSSEMKELAEVLRFQRQVKLMHENLNAPYGGGGGDGGFGGGGGGVFPGEEHVASHKELIKEVRELVKLLKDEKEAKKPEKKPAEEGGGGRGGSK